MRGRDDVVGERGDVGGVLDHDAQDGSDGEVLRAGGLGDLREEAVLHRLERHGRLVGLDVRDDVAGGDRVALLDLPLRDVTLGHRGRERGHTKLLRAGGARVGDGTRDIFSAPKFGPKGGEDRSGAGRTTCGGRVENASDRGANARDARAGARAKRPRRRAAARSVDMRAAACADPGRRGRATRSSEGRAANGRAS